jgi:oligoribonuclease
LKDTGKTKKRTDHLGAGIAGEYYVWFDAEYSDLEIEQAVLLQVAAVITDASLTRVLPPEQDVRLPIRLHADLTPSAWVEENLPELVRECRSPAAIELSEADDRLAEYVDMAVGLPRDRVDARPVLAGNSIHMDWWFVRRFLPNFLRRLNYRLLDVTAFKLQWRLSHPKEKFEKEDPIIVERYFPEAVLPSGQGRHDAYYDAQASISELAFYRRRLFRR